MSQFQLFQSRHFSPLFWTQFLGAFNDNVYKNALIILIIFQGSTWYGFDTNIIVTLSAGIFIMPFFLFSATAGQFADKYEKSMLIRRVKILEIMIMSFAIIGFLFENTLMLIILLFLMGTQSSLFGPLKYSILPQHLSEQELTGGNGLIAMGTFVAILLGTMVGGILISIQGYGPLIIASIVVILALLGFMSSRFIPIAEAASPDLKINWNMATQIFKLMTYAMEKRSVLIGIIAISWFWFMGATYLSQVPAYSKTVLGGNNEVVTLLLTMFSIGIGLGAMLCDTLSRGKIELGLVPLGAIGMTVFSIDLYFASQSFVALSLPPGEMTAIQFLDVSGSGRILVDLALVGLFGGFYTVPLSAMVQQRSAYHRRAQIIAANNMLNALFMVISALSTVMMLHIGFSIPQIFLSLGVLNVVVAVFLFVRLPEFMQRFMAWLRFN
ncbi:MAG: MFS transporter [Thiomargarita sp.]|nr:MFS transporter [Thiomargarita sp.]